MPRYQRFLVPIDFSEQSAATAKVAIDLARQLGASIELLHVIDSRYRDLLLDHGIVDADEHNAHLRKVAADRMQEFLAGLDTAGLAVSTKIVEGVPSHEIVHYGEQTEPDLIVVGTHGHTGLKRAVLGSQAEYVVRHSHKPVLVVHGAA